MSIFRLYSHLRLNIFTNNPLKICCNGFAVVAKKPKAGQTVTKVVVPVETDTQILHDYLCGSHPMKENRQDTKLGDDSEYPDWLWDLRTGCKPPLSEMDPNSKEYFKYVARLKLREKRRLQSLTRLKG